MKIKKAVGINSGGNIYVFFGTLEDGRYFVTGDLEENHVDILDADYWENWDDATYQWMEEHTLETLKDDDAYRFWAEMLEVVTGISEDIRQAEKEWLAERAIERRTVCL